nr:helix-turn-helix domain-containing protein [Enterocloster bolteae]
MDQTGQNIIDAAMELVVERGYTATTTKDIAKRAGVNECTIFRKI